MLEQELNAFGLDLEEVLVFSDGCCLILKLAGNRGAHMICHWLSRDRSLKPQVMDQNLSIILSLLT